MNDVRKIIVICICVIRWEIITYNWNVQEFSKTSCALCKVWGNMGHLGNLVYICGTNILHGLLMARLEYNSLNLYYPIFFWSNDKGEHCSMTNVHFLLSVKPLCCRTFFYVFQTSSLLPLLETWQLWSQGLNLIWNLLSWWISWIKMKYP